MKEFISFVLKWRLAIIVFFLLTTAGLGYFIKDIRVENDIVKFLNQDDPEVKSFNRIGEVYASNYLAVTIVKSKKPFSYKTLSVIKNLSDKIKALDAVIDVTSVVNVMDIKKVDGGLQVGDLIGDNIPQDEKTLEGLKAYILSKDMYRGKIISKNGKYLNIISKIDSKVDKQEVAHKIRSLVNNYKKDHNLKDTSFYYAGYPMIMDFMKESIFHDVKTLVPIVFLLILLTLFLSFGSFRGIILPLSTVVIGIISTVGLMALLGFPMTIVSVLMPVVLIGCGTAYGIHILNKYNEELEEVNIKSYTKLLKHVGIAVLMAGVTTVIGFLSLITATLSLIRDFGLFSAIGMLIALVASFTFSLALLSYMPIRSKRFDFKYKVSLKFMTRFLSKFVVKRPKTIIFITIMLILGSISLFPKIKTEVNFINYFKKDSAPQLAEKIMRTKFGGSLPLSLIVKGDMKSPIVLREMKYYSIDEALFKNNNNPLSVADLINEMNFVLNDSYTIPATKQQIENLWIFIEGKSTLDQMVNSDKTEGLITSTVDKQDTGVMHKVKSDSNRLLNDKYKKGFVVFNPDKLPKDASYFVNFLNSYQIGDYFVKILKNNKIKILDKRLNSASYLQYFVANKIRKIKMDKLKIPHNKIIDYLGGDEAEIELPLKLQNKVENFINKYFNDFTYREEFAFNGLKAFNRELELLLKKNLSKKRYINNKDYTLDLSASLISLLNREAKKQYVDKVFVSLKYRFGTTGKDTQKKLKGLIYEATSSLVLIANNFPKTLNKTTYLLKFKKIAKQYGRLDIPKYSVSGLPIVLDNMDKNLKKSQYSSFLIAFLSVLVLLMFLFKSFKNGLLYSLPIVVAVILNFGFMCLANIPLDNATMMIASIAIGIGVDYAIHFASRLRLELKNAKFEDALVVTMDTTGKAIIINTFTVMLGFLVLLFSDTIPMRNFGWLTSLTMLYSALGAMLFVPSLRLILNKRKHKEV